MSETSLVGFSVRSRCSIAQVQRRRSVESPRLMVAGAAPSFCWRNAFHARRSRSTTCVRSNERWWVCSHQVQNCMRSDRTARWVAGALPAVIRDTRYYSRMRSNILLLRCLSGRRRMVLRLVHLIGSVRIPETWAKSNPLSAPYQPFERSTVPMRKTLGAVFSSFSAAWEIPPQGGALS
jgi:hypothetical protein